MDEAISTLIGVDTPSTHTAHSCAHRSSLATHPATTQAETLTPDLTMIFGPSDAHQDPYTDLPQPRATLGYLARYIELLARSLARSKAMSHFSDESSRLARELRGDSQDPTAGGMYALRNTRTMLQHGERTSLPNSDQLEPSQGYAKPDSTLFPKSRCTCKKSYTSKALGDWSAFIVRPSLGALHASSLEPGERWTESVTSCMREECLRESLRRWKELCLNGTPREDYWVEKLPKSTSVDELDDALLGSVDIPISRKAISEHGGLTWNMVDNLTARLVLPKWKTYDPESPKFEETLREWSGAWDCRAPLSSREEAPEEMTEEEVEDLRVWLEDRGVLPCAFRVNVRASEVESEKPRTLMVLRKD